VNVRRSCVIKRIDIFEISFIITNQQSKATLMTFTTTTLEQFYVIGIAVRTTNQNGQSQKDIGELWQRFFNDKISDRIPEKVNNDIYCIYTDYESDANGTYTTFLGCKVGTLGNIPKGLVSKTIPKAKYQVYKSTGKLPDIVLSTWMHIWNIDIKRKYLADFDVYGQKAQDPNNAEVDTYLSVQ
jgi:predicted transcriptional regulator YdeE